MVNGSLRRWCSMATSASSLRMPDAVDRGKQVVVAAERVWRIGVDDIEEPAAQPRDFREDIAGDRGDRRIPLLGQLLDRGHALAILLDRRRRGRAARDRFEREDAAAGEEIEKVRAVDARAGDVEKGHARALGGRPRLARRNGNAAPAQCAGGDAQRVQRLAAPGVPMK